MAAQEDGSGGGEETLMTTTTPSGSPKNKVKFLCSHGGKILPRPSDGRLKYVGGVTRVVSVSRDIHFSELMKKLSSLSDSDIVLKYQLIPEDLDALVSVKSNDDLRHMLDEYDCCETRGSPKLRAFLFPANPVIMANRTSSLDPHALEQRYIDAVNGIIRTTMAKHPSTSGNHSPIGVSSACSSPRSTDSCTIDYTNHETILPNAYQHSLVQMHRVQSSPSISNLNSQHNHSNHHMHQRHHHCHHNYQQLQHHGCLSPRAHPPERLASVRSMGRADSWKYQVIPSPNYYPIYS